MKLPQFMTMLCLGTDVHLTKAQAQIVRRKIEFIQQGRDALDKALNSKINQSAEIEQVLLDMATGKLPLPSKQDCRVLALQLGTRTELVQKAKFTALS